MQRVSTSWIVIVVMFIVFWPIGLFLLIRKMTADRAARLNDGKSMFIVGGILVVVGLYQMFNYRYSFFMSLFYIGGGVVLILMGMRNKQRSQRYRGYIDLVANRGITNLDTISGMMSVPYDMCQNDLQKMIDGGFFHDTYIDLGRKELVMRPRVPIMAQVPMAAQPVMQQAAPRVVQCKGCGANSTVHGNVAECEYCGSPLA